MVPRILVVVLVPESIDEWLSLSEVQLVLRRCAYWKSLRSLPAIDNSSTVNVTIPRTQIMNPEELKNIMQRVADGGVP